MDTNNPNADASSARDVTASLPPPDPVAIPVRLVIEASGAAQAREVPLLPGQALVVGSGPEADLRLIDRAVSARHASVVHTGAAIEVRDLGARNGLMVGGVRVPSAILPPGASFTVGRTRVRVDLGSSRARTLLPGLVGASEPMRALAAEVRRIAPLRLPVLIRGETGTGKDLVARAVHAESSRASGPFVTLNAAAITREIAESELFGHRRGAFTGAVRDRRGAFREAHGGTLFLDEIGSISLELQAKLLRAVEEGAVRPLGDEAMVPVDVRLCAATCEPLEELVHARRFRADLYERLAVCVVVVPPLRKRPEDIAALGRHLLVASELGDRAVAPDALGVLRSQRWPGNVRELRNVLVQAAVRSGGTVEARHVTAVLAERGVKTRRLDPDEALRVFDEAGRNVSAAARTFDVPRSTMRDMLRARGVEPWPARRGSSAR